MAEEFGVPTGGRRSILARNGRGNKCGRREGRVRVRDGKCGK